MTFILFAGLYYAFILFTYCYFGKVATDSFQNMADCIYEMNWHELPIEQQKYFILMIANTQKPLYYHGFNVTLNLETFCQVSNFVKFHTVSYKLLTVFFPISLVRSNDLLLLHDLHYPHRERIKESLIAIHIYTTILLNCFFDLC